MSQGTKRSYIKGLGVYYPDRIVTNDDLAEVMDTSDEWIQARTGIVERRHVEDGTNSSDLAREASLKAADNAGIDINDVDMVIFATLSPDHQFPGTACYLQQKLDIPGIPCLDIRQQCTGFIYGLTIADSLVRTGPYQNILLVGAEVHSHSLDFSDAGRDVTVLFGDAAGAAIVSPAPEGSDKGILAHALHANGHFAESLCIHGWHMSRMPYMAPEDLENGEQWPRMEGRRVFKEAVSHLPKVIGEVLDITGHTIEDIDLLVPHQANLRINEFAAMSMGIAPHKVYNNIQRYGNTTAASIPLALYEAIEEGLAPEGSLVCLAAFGSGFTWGAVTMRW